MSDRSLGFASSLRTTVFVAGLLIVAAVSIALWAARGDDLSLRRPGHRDASPPAAPLPLADVRIAVDAGHGGRDQGVCFFPDNLIEKEINLDMALRLEKALMAQGAQVYLTRDEDRFMSIDNRAQAANESGAALLVSLHVNRMPGHPDCFGAQTFFYPDATEGQRLADSLQAELLKIDPDNYRTALSGRYKLLRLAEMPGVIVEIGFLTSERDRQLIQGDGYRSKVIDALVTGIVRYIDGDGEGREL